MPYISYDKLWRTEFYNNVSAIDIVQDINLSQEKLQVKDAFNKDEKTATEFEAVNDEDVMNKGYLDTKSAEVKCHISYIEKIIRIKRIMEYLIQKFFLKIL